MSLTGDPYLDIDLCQRIHGHHMENIKKELNIYHLSKVARAMNKILVITPKYSDKWYDGIELSLSKVKYLPYFE